MSVKKGSFIKHNILFWTIFSLPIIGLIILFTLISNGKLGFMPTFEELENPKSNLAAEIISEDGEILGKYFYENRNYVNFNELSPHLVNALIATEDIRFLKHAGIDSRSLGRVLFRTVLMRDQSSGGGSTISQQLAKLLFHERPNSLLKRAKQKLNEWVIAIKLEKRYTKEEILAMYLNQIDFLNLAVGIKSASKVYFNTTPASLKLEEAALLIGMVKNPAIYNPLRRPEKTQNRRNIVLGQMYKYGFIAEDVYDSIAAIPLELDYQKVDHNEGEATYFREYLRVYMSYEKPERKRYKNYSTYKEDSIDWATDPLFGWCNKNTKPDGTPYNLYKDGIRIYTTINYKMQRYAEEAMAKHLGEFLQPYFFKEKKGYKNAPFSEDLEPEEIDEIMDQAMYRSVRYRRLRQAGLDKEEIRKIFDEPTEMTVFTWNGEVDTVMTPWDSIKYYKHFLHTGIMSVDPLTGYTKVYVGGINSKHFQYDHVRIGKRQAGSTFKPFLYILAMQEGFSPCREVPVVPQMFKVNDSIWIPKTTARPEYIGTMKTLQWGLAKSENYISAWLLKQFNPVSIVEIAHKMGIKSYVDPVPSMIYGVSDVNVYEMVGAFGTFANKGVHIDPIFVTRIEDRYGNVLANFIPYKEEAIGERTAYLMLHLLQGVVNRGSGSGVRSRFGITAELGGKTGTTQNHSDGWFIGIAPKLVTGIWVGAEDRSAHFDELGMGSGTTMALPIWAYFMQKVYADSTLGITQEDIFDIPENFDVNINCNDDSSNELYDTPTDYGGTWN